jgi:hypothetical protein
MRSRCYEICDLSWLGRGPSWNGQWFNGHRELDQCCVREFYPGTSLFSYSAVSSNVTETQSPAPQHWPAKDVSSASVTPNRNRCSSIAAHVSVSHREVVLRLLREPTVTLLDRSAITSFVLVCFTVPAASPGMRASPAQTFRPPSAQPARSSHTPLGDAASALVAASSGTAARQIAEQSEWRGWQ